jgi:hypothetical protein
MDAPRGSDEFAASAELQRLQRRAYGPDADIVGDVAAQTRLAELLEDSRRQATPLVDAAPRVFGPVPERTGSLDSVEQLTNGGDHDNGPPATLEGAGGRPHRGGVSQILPWVVAAVAGLAATIAIGVLVVSEASELRPVAQLTPQSVGADGSVPIDRGTALEWNATDSADYVSYGSYGAAEIWSTTTTGPKQCLGVVVHGSTWRFNCTAPTIDTIADIDIDPSEVPPTPSGEPASNIRFVLHDGVVDVYLVPHPDGGFYK